MFVNILLQIEAKPVSQRLLSFYERSSVVNSKLSDHGIILRPLRQIRSQYSSSVEAINFTVESKSLAVEVNSSTFESYSLFFGCRS